MPRFATQLQELLARIPPLEVGIRPGSFADTTYLGLYGTPSAAGPFLFNPTGAPLDPVTRRHEAEHVANFYRNLLGAGISQPEDELLAYETEPTAPPAELLREYKRRYEELVKKPYESRNAPTPRGRKRKKVHAAFPAY